MYTKDYIDELSRQLDETTTEDEAAVFVDAFHDLAKHFRFLKAMIPASMDADAYSALHADLEHLEALCADESNRAEDVAEENYQAMRDEQQYGSYEDQVRSQYYVGRL